MISQTGLKDFARGLALITVAMGAVIQPVLASKNKDTDKQEAIVDVYPFKSSEHGQVKQHEHDKLAAVRKASNSKSSSEKNMVSDKHVEKKIKAILKSKNKNSNSDNNLSVHPIRQKQKSALVAHSNNEMKEKEPVRQVFAVPNKKNSMVVVPAAKFREMLKNNAEGTSGVKVVDVPVVPPHAVGQNEVVRKSSSALPLPKFSSSSVPVTVRSVPVPVQVVSVTVPAANAVSQDADNVAEQMARDIAQEEAEQRERLKKNRKSDLLQAEKPAMTGVTSVSATVKTPSVITVSKQVATVELPETLSETDNVATSRPKGGVKALVGTSIGLLPTFIVAIDPGHGGDDSGAIGPGHVREKDVTLAIGKKLAAVLEKNGIKPVLTRSTDVFLELRSRMDVAREAHANLFVSIHANSAPHPGARGTAVYVLSDHGVMTEQARWLSRKENSADFVGGLSLKQRDPEVAQVLLDISQSATLEASFALANAVLTHVGSFNYLEKRAPQQAGFMVLKAPDIPSILVETDFINSESGADMLSSKSFQDRMANSVGMAIKDYRDKYAPIQQKAPKLYAASNKSGT